MRRDTTIENNFTRKTNTLIHKYYAATGPAMVSGAFTFGSITNSISYSMWWMWYWLWSVEEMKRTAKTVNTFSAFFLLLLLSVSFLRKSRLAHSFGVSGPLLPSRHIYSFLLIYLIEVICLILCENSFLSSSLSLPRSPVTVTVTISMNFSQRRFKSDNFCPNSIWFMFET